MELGLFVLALRGNKGVRNDNNEYSILEMFVMGERVCGSK